MHSLISEEKSIFEEYSYVESTQVTVPYKKFVEYYNKMCALRERAVNNRLNIIPINPPTCARNIWYALDCVNPWLYPPNPDTGLDIWTVSNVINAWLYPIQ
jgi:hypothetical protein